MTDLTSAAIAGKPHVNVTRVIDGGTFNGFSARVAVICFLAIVFDGIDSALFGTLLPAIMADMQMGPAAAGILASVGHIGAVGGAIVFGVAADAIGRKRMMLIGMALFISFTAACGLAQGIVDFAVYRFIAGFGLAGIVPIAVALVFEYTPGKWKAMASSVSYTGISVGVLLSAVLSMVFLANFGWRAILLGTFVCILLVPVAMVWLPESMSILVKKGRQQRIGQILHSANPQFVPAASDEYGLDEPPAPRVPLKRLFQGGYARNTLFLGVGMLCIMMVAVTLTTWIAQLMVQRGYSMTTGISFILVFTCSNFISTPLAGWMADRMGYRAVFSLYMPVLFVSISLIGVIQSPLGALICMFFAGFAAMGATCILLPYVGSLYPQSFRSTAMGVIYAIGRVGPIVGPAIAGFMLAAGVSVPLILVCVAAPALLALAAFLLVKEAVAQ
ncbi:MAG: MFS transporter [Pseudomonas putida]|nr:MFS transporter [Pseudomonas putida]